MPAQELSPAIELFRHRFLHALRAGKHISPSRLADLLSWKHSGFNIHEGGEKPVPAHDTEGRKRLAEYLLRHSFSLQKITWNPTTQTVIYRSKRHHTTKRNFEIFKAPEQIAFFLRLHGLWEGIIQLPRPPPPPFDIETMEPIEPPWLAIKEWIPDDEPDLDWFNRPRNPSNPDPDGIDQSQTWQAPEIHLDDGRILVLEYT